MVFATYHGNLVVRDVITGAPVANLFLHDEEELAKSKLELVFRALNDGDATGLNVLCTPGFLESLKKRAGDEGGSILTRGQHIALNKVGAVPSVSLRPEVGARSGACQLSGCERPSPSIRHRFRTNWQRSESGSRAGPAGRRHRMGSGHRQLSQSSIRAAGRPACAKRRGVRRSEFRFAFFFA